MNTEKRLKVAIVVLGVLLFFAAAFGAGMRNSLDEVKRGGQEGFDLNGTYNNPGAAEPSGGISSVSFLVKDEEARSGEWQAREPDGDLLNGTFESTHDPNIYRLFDEDGNEIALAHVAYTGATGNSAKDGVGIVVMGDSLEFELPKSESGPMFISHEP